MPNKPTTGGTGGVSDNFGNNVPQPTTLREEFLKEFDDWKTSELNRMVDWWLEKIAFETEKDYLKGYRDGQTSHNTELIRKVEGLKNSKKMRERSLISPLESYRIDDQEYGFNQALDEVISLINQEK